MRFKLKRELLLLVTVFSSRVCAKNYLQTRLGRTQLAGVEGVGGAVGAVLKPAGWSSLDSEPSGPIAPARAWMHKAKLNSSSALCSTKFNRGEAKKRRIAYF